MPIIKPVKHGEDNPIELAPELTEEEKYTLENKRKAMDELLKRECIGKYKIEVLFSHKRSVTEPTAGVLSIWESGSRLHGGGDAKMYFCPARARNLGECSAVIPFDNCNYGHLLCPVCGKVWKADDVIGEILGRWTMQVWAHKIAQHFAHLGHNADVYVKHPRGDIREAARLEQERQLMGDKLNVVRKGIVKYIYPLKRILQDTQNGSDIEGRFYAFLKS